MAELVRKDLPYWVARLRRQAKWIEEARQDDDPYELKVQVQNQINTIEEFERWMIDNG